MLRPLFRPPMVSRLSRAPLAASSNANAEAGAAAAAATAAPRDTAAGAVSTASRPSLQAHLQRRLYHLQLKQQQQRLFTPTTAANAPASAPEGPPTQPLSGPRVGGPVGPPPPFASVVLPAYIRQLHLNDWTLLFYPVPQYLKCMPENTQWGPLDISQGAPSSWEGAALAAALQPQLLCLECCSNRLQQLAAAAEAAAAAAARGGSLQQETRKQQKNLARGFSLLTSFDGGETQAVHPGT